MLGKVVAEIVKKVPRRREDGIGNVARRPGARR
jgi:hypothetical protein